MGEKKREVGFEGSLPREQVLATLEELSASIRAGSIRVATGDRQIVLSPAETVTLFVEARQKKDKHRVLFELRWHGEAAAGES